MSDQQPRPQQPQYPEYPGEILQPGPPPTPQGYPTPGQAYPPPPGQAYPPPPGQAYPPPPGQAYPPPGHQTPYGYPPQMPLSARVLEPLKGLGVAAAVLATIYSASTIAGAVLAWPARDTWLDEAAIGNDPTEVTTAWDVVTFLGLFYLLVPYILTSLWMYRARANSELISPASPHTLPRGWVWGGWVCPVVNLWFPIMMLQNILRASAPGRRHGLLLGLWWGSWIASWVAFWTQMAFVPFDGIDDLTDSHRFACIVTAALFTITCGLWIAVIRRVNDAQQASTP